MELHNLLSFKEFGENDLPKHNPTKRTETSIDVLKENKCDCHNLLSFKEFGENDLPKYKPTKRTETSIDVLNENFYDKLAFRIKEKRELPIDEFKTRMIKAATSGSLKNLKKDNDTYTFTILDKKFKFECKTDKCIVSFHTPKTEKGNEWNKFELNKKDFDEIIEEFNK